MELYSKTNETFLLESHKFPGIFIARGLEDCLATLSKNPGNSTYGEKVIFTFFNDKKLEFRIWNPFRSKLSAAILLGINSLYFTKGSKILYIGASSGTTISHCSDIIGHKGLIYAVEFSYNCILQLLFTCTNRVNIVPIFGDARRPYKYQILIPLVDSIITDISQPDQIRILGLNALYFLKKKGYFLISIKSRNIDSFSPEESLVAKEKEKLCKLGLFPTEQITLEPYDRSHALLGGYFNL
ncbi:fibrillarin like-protein (nucleomorph) [Lotharella oceanica]|uniref:rRNA 2'-O-methyltransferase fibrillarin n=1 Tax=Lotharella oceanica TaxID=641309 RepID=A0A060DBH9_9EUKA|nr:fibrillarin like-protein [Lotharella oceanica]|mmetsp:Transcript_4220/g.8187  ORF Transcript_4220/g.8187 Transcript_4220/m.8187 type:complete len:241 (+) Transcript_4220:1017-1739(+)